MEKNDFRVGDFVFLFFTNNGLISPARVLEKNIRENIEDGLTIEFFLEVYKKEDETLQKISYKFDNSKCSMYKTIEELREELQNHVNNAVNNMVDECRETLEEATTLGEEKNFEENIIT